MEDRRKEPSSRLFLLLVVGEGVTEIAIAPLPIKFPSGCQTPLLCNSSKTVPWLCRPRPPSSFCGRSPTAGDFGVVRGQRRRHPPAESDAHASSACVPANSIGEAGRALVPAWSVGGWRLTWLLLCGCPSVVVLAGRWCCCFSRRVSERCRGWQVLESTLDFPLRPTKLCLEFGVVDAVVVVVGDVAGGCDLT